MGSSLSDTAQNDHGSYRHRNLKRIVTRYDRHAQTYFSALVLARHHRILSLSPGSRGSEARAEVGYMEHGPARRTDTANEERCPRRALRIGGAEHGRSQRSIH